MSGLSVDNFKKIRGVLFFLVISIIIIFIWIQYAAAPYFILAFAIGLLTLLLAKEIYLLYLYSIFFWVTPPLGWGQLKDLLTGAYVAEIGIYAGIIGWFLKNLFTVDLKIWIKSVLKTPLLLPLSLFCAGSIFAFINGNPSDRNQAFAQVRYTSFYVFSLYFLCTKIVVNSQQAKMVIMAVISGACILGVVFFYQFNFRPDLISGDFYLQRLGGHVEMGSIGINLTALGLGEHFAVLIPFSIMLLLSGKKGFGKVFGFLSLLFISYFLLLTGSRSCWLAALMGICAFFYLSKKFHYEFNNRSILFFIFIFLFVLILSYGLAPESIIKRIKEMQYASEDISLLERFDIWKDAVRLFFSNPLGLSFGFYPLSSRLTTPHNTYLSIALTNGLIGLIGFAWFVIAWFRKISFFIKIVGPEEKLIYISSIASIICFLISSFFDSYNIYFLNISSTWLIFGLAMFSNKNFRSKDAACISQN